MSELKLPQAVMEQAATSAVPPLVALSGQRVAARITGPLREERLMEKVAVLPEEAAAQVLRHVSRALQIQYMGKVQEWYSPATLLQAQLENSLEFIGKEKKEDSAPEWEPSSKGLQCTEEYDRATKQKHGKNIWWYENGRMMSLEFWHQGKRRGERKMWSRDGDLILREFYDDEGKKHGRCEAWWRSGKKRSDFEFNHGKQLKGQKWDALGKLAK